MSDVKLDRIIEMFQILADNEYSALWDHVEDFEYNGHKISVKRSTQFKQVIIDNRYVSIGGNAVQMVPAANGKYISMTPIEYAKYVLSK